MEDSQDEEGVMVGGAMMLPSKDIVDNAIESEDHTTLVAAVQAAGLVDTLKSEGPFTVFAPTNGAFDKLPEGTVDMLLQEENIDDLTTILTYHVVPGIFTSADLTDGLELETVQGNTVVITYEDDMWKINGATIEIADAMSSNGVTHVIDEVLTLNLDEDTTSDDEMSDTDEMNDVE
ncbi:fasciclin domain-containing protein [Candidatus Gracilibacteria bacterium]|nr:fasciclin domain-containing protein [Candidatus Gracilibacteria bacterium]